MGLGSWASVILLCASMPVAAQQWTASPAQDQAAPDREHPTSPITLRPCQAYYTIGFDPPAAEHVDEYHELAVKVDKPGTTAHTNSGYYSQPAFKP
jgi:hypothetical protein